MPPRRGTGRETLLAHGDHSPAHGSASHRRDHQGRGMAGGGDTGRVQQARRARRSHRADAGVDRLRQGGTPHRLPLLDATRGETGGECQGNRRPGLHRRLRRDHARPAEERGGIPFCRQLDLRPPFSRRRDSLDQDRGRPLGFPADRLRMGGRDEHPVQGPWKRGTRSRRQVGHAPRTLGSDPEAGVFPMVRPHGLDLACAGEFRDHRLWREVPGGEPHHSLGLGNRPASPR